MKHLPVAFVVLALGGCGGELTEVVFCYAVDARYVGSMTMAQVTAFTDSDELLYRSSIEPVAGRDQAQGFVQDSADGLRVLFDATIANQPDPMGGPGLVTIQVSQMAEVEFQPGRIVDVMLRIEPACAGVLCAAGETCAEGECLPERIEPDCLPDHGLAPPPTCEDRRVDFSCADPALSR